MARISPSLPIMLAIGVCSACAQADLVARRWDTPSASPAGPARRPTPGGKFTWTNTSAADGKEVGSGAVAADKWGFVTIEKLIVTKGKNRIRIGR